MGQSFNAIMPKPDYTHHRVKTGAPAVADVAVASLTATDLRAALNCEGWSSIKVLVKLTGGTSIDVQPVEVVRYRDDDGASENTSEEAIVGGSTEAGVTDGDTFVLAVNGARVYLRVALVTGAVTKVEILAVGDVAAPAVGVGGRY